MEKTEYENATRCCLCRLEILEDDFCRCKVRDHDHITGNYLGAAHRKCNFELPIKYLIPVFFHNFRGYDSHLIVRQFQYYKKRQIQVIGQNMENYLQIKWGNNIVFRDSLQFLFSSLEALAGSLIKSGRQNFNHLHQVIANRYTNANVELLERKGIFCYDYLDSFERVAETQLPERGQFFSKLTDEESKP